MFLYPRSRRAFQLQRDHAGYRHRGAHHRPHCPLCHRYPGVQTHPPEPNGEANVPRCRVRNHRWPHRIKCGREHSGGE